MAHSSSCWHDRPHPTLSAELHPFGRAGRCWGIVPVRHLVSVSGSIRPPAHSQEWAGSRRLGPSSGHLPYDGLQSLCDLRGAAVAQSVSPMRLFPLVAAETPEAPVVGGPTFHVPHRCLLLLVRPCLISAPEPRLCFGADATAGVVAQGREPAAAFLRSGQVAHLLPPHRSSLPTHKPYVLAVALP